MSATCQRLAVQDRGGWPQSSHAPKPLQRASSTWHARSSRPQLRSRHSNPSKSRVAGTRDASLRHSGQSIDTEIPTLNPPRIGHDAGSANNGQVRFWAEAQSSWAGRIQEAPPPAAMPALGPNLLGRRKTRSPHLHVRDILRLSVDPSKAPCGQKRHKLPAHSWSATLSHLARKCGMPQKMRQTARIPRPQTAAGEVSRVGTRCAART
jgi:hypothetical protein